MRQIEIQVNAVLVGHGSEDSGGFFFNSHFSRAAWMLAMYGPLPVRIPARWLVASSPLSCCPK